MQKIQKLAVMATAVLFLSPAILGAAEANKETLALQKGYQLAKKKCLSCHDSVANPEAGKKPGMIGTWWSMLCTSSFS